MVRIHDDPNENGEKADRDGDQKRGKKG